MKLYHLDDSEYTAFRLCEIILENRGNLFNVWREEDEAVTEKRHELFVKGANKFLKR